MNIVVGIHEYIVGGIPEKSSEKTKLKENVFPEDWDDKRVARVLAHYENQTQDEALAEDEAAFLTNGQTIMEIPTELVPAVRELVARHTHQIR